MRAPSMGARSDGKNHTGPDTVVTSGSRERTARNSAAKRPKTARTADPAATPPRIEADPALSSSQTDAALDMIRSRIIDMTLQPGVRIDERLLIEQFRLGRTPAREAINRLVAEGFVHIVPQRGGTFVRKLDLDEMGEVVTAHQLAESVLGQMCRFNDAGLLADLQAIQQQYVGAVNRREFLLITQLNQDFHLRMHRTIGNALFYNFAESTHRHVRRLNVYVYQREQADPEFHAAQFAANLEQHDQIIDAISRRDRDTLADLLPAHAKYTQLRLIRLLETKSAAPVKLNLQGLNPATAAG